MSCIINSTVKTIIGIENKDIISKSLKFNKYKIIKIMPKSKKRGGEKAYRKRVNSRNNHLAGVQKKMQEEYNAEMEKRLEEYKKTLSADTENTEVMGNEEPLNIRL